MALDRSIRGLRDSIPSGYIIGRQSSGSGRPELISLSSLGQQLAATGVTPTAQNLSQFIDTAFGDTEGSILVRGASGWEALTAGLAGQVLESNGATSVPSWGSGGGSNFLPFNPSAPNSPAATAFGSIQNSSTYTATLTTLTSGRGSVLTIPAASGVVGAYAPYSGYTPPAAGTNFSVVAQILFSGYATTSGWVTGIGLQDSAGKTLLFTLSANPEFQTFSFNASMVYSTSSTITTTTNAPNVPCWLRLQRSGTNFVFYFSADGENWAELGTASSTGFLGSTISTVGVGCGVNNSGKFTQYMSIFDFTTLAS